MRFAVHILLLSTLLGFSFTAASAQTQITSKKNPQSKVNADVLENYTDLRLAPTTLPARLQKGQQASRLKTADGLSFTRFARRLGEISAISSGASGELYVADRQSGRIFVIPDRNQDSRAEQIRPLPYRFNSPSAVIEIGQHLYVADNDAIWKLPIQSSFGRPAPEARSETSPNSGADTGSAHQAPVVLASLKNIQNRGAYFLTANSGADIQTSAASLVLGYSAPNGKARLLSINVRTGRADLLDEVNGELVQLISPSNLDNINAKPWVVFRTKDGLHIGPNFNNASYLGENLNVAGMALPYSGPQTVDWPTDLREHIFISQTDPIRIMALPTSLGIVLPQGRDVFTGFQDSRTAWGQTGVLHMDKRGLFAADPYNGELWLIAPKDKTIPSKPVSGLKAALDKIKAVEGQHSEDLSRNPLAGIHDSLFPVSRESKDKTIPNDNTATESDTPKPKPTPPR
ncbi:MAG: hypothetical protein ABJG88_09795 [Litorimonas sp.]